MVFILTGLAFQLSVRLETINSKLDDLLRLCRKISETSDHTIRLERHQLGSLESKADGSHSDLNRSEQCKASNQPSHTESDRRLRINFWARLSPADRIQSIIGLLLLLTLFVGIKSYQLSRDSLISVQRAFLNPSIREKSQIPFTFLRTADHGAGDGVIIHIDWENTGATEAPVVVGFSTFTYVSIGSLDKWDFFQGADFGKLHAAFLGPRSMLSPDPIALPKGALYNPNNVLEPMPGKEIVVWGWRAYRDAFPNTKPHLTEFCYVAGGITRDPTMPDPKSIEIDFAPCTPHNCTDGHCADYKTMVAYLPE